MINFLHKRHYDRFCKYVDNFAQIFGKWGKYFRVPVLCVLPSDTLLTQFRKAPESAELTGSLLQPSPASLKGHLITEVSGAA